MKIQDLLLPLCLGLITTWGIQYFFFYNKEGGQEAQTFVAPVTKQEVKPLNIEVDFLDTDHQHEPEICPVDTPWGRLQFSTSGASLQELTFKRTINGAVQELQTISPSLERDAAPFLVAFPEKTPFNYTMKSCTLNEKGTTVEYHAENDAWIIDKSFFVHNDTHTIDMMVEVNPKKEASTSVRVLFPSPSLPSLASDVISSVIVTKKDQFEKTGRDKLSEHKGWLSPQIFGSDDRYFVHTLIKDDNGFTDRADYKLNGKNELTSILESSEITNKTTWKMSFYCGPKDLADLEAVDSRLENTLEYAGIFAPVSKFLLKILRVLYSYLHNYGLAIIALTILIKLVMLPLTIKNDRGMKDRLEFQKKIAYLRQRYKHDPETLQREQAELFKKHGFGNFGCLPMLIQLPFLFGLSRLLSGSIELYRAPMAWIPDLAGRDPYYILPIVVCIALLFQTALSSNTAMDAKQRLTGMAMAVLFGAVTVNLSAGLALYICISTVLSVLQTRILQSFK